jgi:hypothetical protein
MVAAIFFRFDWSIRPKRNRNIKNIFIMLQRGTNIIANQAKTPMQNYFEKVLYENLTLDILKKCCMKIRVITKLPNSEQSYKGKVKTHNYINRQNQSTTGKR